MVGFVTSLAVLIIVIMYSSMQLHRLNRYSENLLTTSVKDSYFDHDYEISTENNGLKFAFALTAYDNNTAYVDESEYGHVTAMYVQWGIEGDSYSEK